MTKNAFKTKLTTLSASNKAFRAMMGPRAVIVPPAPVTGAVAGPIEIGSSLTPHFQALQKHADDFDTLLDILEDLIAKL